jgi:hypothetical protein
MEEKVLPAKRVLSASSKEEFAAFLEAAARHPELFVLSNRYPWQARMAADRLLDLAAEKKMEVRILSGQCHEGFYNQDFATKLHRCFAAGCRVRILVWQQSFDGISAKLIEMAKDKQIDLKVSGTNEYASSIPHFLLIGESAFRQEAGHDPFTAQTKFNEIEPQVPARIDFNDPEAGKVLAGLFDTFWGGRG